MSEEISQCIHEKYPRQVSGMLAYAGRIPGEILGYLVEFLEKSLMEIQEECLEDLLKNLILYLMNSSINLWESFIP